MTDKERPKVEDAIGEHLGVKEPDIVKAMIPALTEPYQRPLKDPKTAQKAFQELLADIASFALVDSWNTFRDSLTAKTAGKIVEAMRSQLNQIKLVQTARINQARLNTALEKQGLNKVKVPDDGDCFYHAMGVHVSRTALEVRGRLSQALGTSLINKTITISYMTIFKKCSSGSALTTWVLT